MSDRKKEAFKKELKGEPIAYDLFGVPILEGDYILYAVAQQSAAEIKIGKILAVIDKKDDWSSKVTRKAKVQRVEQGWRTEDKWELGGRPSYLTKFDKVVVLKDVPSEILKIIEDAGL